MKFTETNLKGSFVIDLTPIQDERGFFARTFCKNEFAEHNLESNFVQSNTSRSLLQYTLRGMHYQVNGFEEVKLIRCIRGKIQDVIIDLRPNSPTYCQSTSVELSEENKKTFYIPKGFAHGFLTLVPDCEVIYMVSSFYSPINEKGVRWNDPLFNINWQNNPKEISEKDRKHPNFMK